jgi:hypothetical protein
VTHGSRDRACHVQDMCHALESGVKGPCDGDVGHDDELKTRQIRTELGIALEQSGLLSSTHRRADGVTCLECFDQRCEADEAGRAGDLCVYSVSRQSSAIPSG